MSNEKKSEKASSEPDQKVGEAPPEGKKAEAKAQTGKTFQGEGTEKRG